MALYLGGAWALPHPGARTSSAGGHEDTALCCHGRVVIVAVAFYAVPCHLNLGAPSPRGQQAAGPTVTARSPLFMPQCCRAAKLAATATLLPPPPCYCRFRCCCSRSFS